VGFLSSKDICLVPPRWVCSCTCGFLFASLFPVAADNEVVDQDMQLLCNVKTSPQLEMEQEQEIER